MNAPKDNKILALVVVVVLIIVTVQAFNNISEANNLGKQESIVSKSQVSHMSDTKISGDLGYSTEARASVCINIPPILTYDCNMTNAILNTSIIYNCTFNATDPNADPFIFYSNWLTLPEMFNITPNGSINFRPKRSLMDDVNTFRIYINDSSGCANFYTMKEFNVTVIGENRPPYLMQNISNQTIIKDQYYMFYLNDYFADPDDDPLAYFSIMTHGSTVKIKIKDNAVEIKGSKCGITTAYFIASDPLGLTARSNTVKYEVTCPDEQLAPPIQQQDNGGGGSGSTSRNCSPDWRCSVWSSCQVGNFSYKRCIDYNGCSQQYEQFLFQNCTYTQHRNCDEQWNCNNWSICDNGIHRRICLDLRTCGTNTTKPQESENCSAIATCFNGLQDQEETGIDCGGPCGACRNIENPARINNVNLAILLTGTLTVSLVLASLYIFRDRLKKIYSSIFKRKEKFRRKTYINEKQKNVLIQELNIIQARLDEHKINHAIDETVIFIQEYFKQLLSMEHLEKQELITQITRLKDKDLEKILILFYAKILNTVHLRNTGKIITDNEAWALIDEISYKIFLIAEFTDSDAINSPKERLSESKEPIEIIFNKLSNLYIALKFGEVLIAKSIYKEILTYYERLSNKDKINLYTDIVSAYESINFQER